MDKQQEIAINRLKTLTLKDLERWAGSTIVSRGKSYQRNGSVKNLTCSVDGKLTAQVRGSETYTTQVSLTKERELISSCSCAYNDTCRHAVAVVLEFLEQVKQGSEIFSLSSLFDYLNSQTKEQLIALFKELIQYDSSVIDLLKARITSKNVDPKKIIAFIKQEIAQFDNQLNWDSSFSETHQLKQQIGSLLISGHVDEAIQIGQELLSAGSRCVEMNGDEYLISEIVDCITLIFEALPRSSMSFVKQVLWAINMELEDEYELCEGKDRFWQHPFSTGDWSDAADALLKRIISLPLKKEDKNYSSNEYDFNRLSDHLINLLRKAGREAEIIPLYKQQLLGKTGSSYLSFVKLLQEAGRTEEALQWIHRGVEATEKEEPTITSQLRKVFQNVQEEAGNQEQVVALIAEDFFNSPSVKSFNELKESAKNINASPVIREAALRYLETGYLPFDSEKWPLPRAAIKSQYKKLLKEFPDTITLLELAIAEERPNDVVHWFSKIDVTSSALRSVSLRERVAKAIIATHPDEAIPILKEIAEELIDSTKVPAYYDAMNYLRPVRSTLLNFGRGEEWDAYLKQLQQKYSLKRKLLKILDTLEKPNSN